MEPISLAAVSLGISEVSTQNIKRLRLALKGNPDLHAELSAHAEHFEACTQLLNIISPNLSTETGVPGSDIGIKLCLDSMDRIGKILQSIEIAKGKGKVTQALRLPDLVSQLQEEIKSFRSSIDFLGICSQQ